MTNAVRSSFIPYERKTSYLKIYRYEGRRPVGTLENSYFSQPLCFGCLSELLILLDALMDAIQYPPRYMEDRRFAPELGQQLIREAMRPPSWEEKPIASFKLNVLFRQNASWQGTLVWLEEHAESQFRSALELIMLLDEALMSPGGGREQN